MGLSAILFNIRNVVLFTAVIIHTVFIFLTYAFWTWVILIPLRIIHKKTYWYLEGICFDWALYFVGCLSWRSNYIVEEFGDDVTSCKDQKCLILSNHQSTADVPMLMTYFAAKGNVHNYLMWIVDKMFRYTHFGAACAIHGDFFIAEGQKGRDVVLRKLKEHLLNVYLPRDRKWIMLFPEGGFLRNRLESSQRYAKKNGFPVLKYTSLPRLGAMHVVMSTLCPGKIEKVYPNQNQLEKEEKIEPLKWVIDITIAYPDQENVMEMSTLASGHIPYNTTTKMYLRRYPVEEIPTDDIDSLTKWLFDRWVEKEEILKEYYTTGKFLSNLNGNRNPRKVILSDSRFAVAVSFVYLNLSCVIYLLYLLFSYAV